MKKKAGLWAWVGERKSQKTLAWIGGAFVAIATALISFHDKIFPTPTPRPTTVVQPASPPAAAPQPPADVVQKPEGGATANVKTGDIRAGPGATVIIDNTATQTQSDRAAKK